MGKTFKKLKLIEDNCTKVVLDIYVSGTEKVEGSIKTRRLYFHGSGKALVGNFVLYFRLNKITIEEYVSFWLIRLNSNATLKVHKKLSYMFKNFDKTINNLNFE